MKIRETSGEAHAARGGALLSVKPPDKISPTPAPSPFSPSPYKYRLFMSRDFPSEIDSSIFSASSLQTYQNCPLQYKFCYVDKIPSQPTPPMIFGSAIHSIIEHLTTNPDRTLEPADHARSLLEEFWPTGICTTEFEEKEARASAHAILDTYLAWQGANTNTVTSVEHEFTFECEGHTLNGFIDRIEQTPGGGHVVIDFKSGKKPGTISKNTIKKNIQMNMYCLAVRHMTGSLPERAESFS